MSYLIFLIFIFLYNSTLVIISNKKFGKVLPISLISMTLVMYFSQLIFKTFKVGLYTNYFIALLSIILFVYMIIYNKVKENKYKIKEIKNNILSSGFYGFLSIFILLFVINFNRHFTTWDELSHWGEMVKEMIRLDKFYTDNLSTLIFHKDYPPFISLFELLPCLMTKSYNEGLVTFSIQFFSLGLLTPMLLEVKTDNNKFIKFLSNLFLNVVMIILIIAFDADNVFPTIYTDFYMAFLFVYSIIQIINKNVYTDKFGYISLILTSISLLLTKQMGIALFLMIVVYYIIELFNNKLINKKNYKKYVALILILLVIPFLNLKLWNNYVSKFKIEKQFDLSTINIGNIVKIIKNDNGFENRHEGLKNYINALFSRKLYNNAIGITYVSSIFLIILLVYLLWYFYKNYFDKVKAIFLAIILTLGSLGYSFTMLILYMFSFDEGEAVNIASYNRYMSTYIVAEILILFILLIQLEIKKNKNTLKFNKIFVVSLFFLVVFRGGNLSFFLPSVFKNDPMREYRDFSEVIKQKTEENSKIFVLSNSIGQVQIFLHYYTNPRIIDRNYHNAIDLDYNNSIKNNIIKEISKNDYVFVINSNENFNNEFKNIFQDEKITEGAIYKVSIDIDNKIKLIEV